MSLIDHDGDAGTGPVRSTAPHGAVLVLCAAQFIAMYDTASMTVAMSDIVADLDTTVAGVQSAIALFTLVMAALMLPAARLADHWGRRNTFLAGVVVYGVGAGLTSISVNLPMMVLSWSFIEGIGAAMMLPTILVLVAENTAPGDERVRAMSLVAATSAVGAAAGPILGGLLTTLATWRLSFAAEVLVVVAVVLLRRRVSDTPMRDANFKLDAWSLVLWAGGLGFLIVGALSASAFGWIRTRKDVVVAGRTLISQGGYAPFVWLSIAGAAVLIGFVARQVALTRGGGQPLVSSTLLRHRVLTGASLSNLGLMFIQASVVFLVPVFLQVGLGYSALATGMSLLPLTVGVIITSSVAVTLSTRWTLGGLAATGFGVCAVGALLLFLEVSFGESGWALSPGLLLIGLGIGMALAPLSNAAIAAAGPAHANEASGYFKSLTQLGSSLGTAFAGAIMISVLVTAFTVGTEESTILTATQQQAAIDAIDNDAQVASDSQVATVVADLPAPAADEIVRINDDARDTALAASILLLAGAALLGMIPTRLLPRGRRHAAPGAAPPGDGW